MQKHLFILSYLDITCNDLLINIIIYLSILITPSTHLSIYLFMYLSIYSLSLNLTIH